MEKGRLAESVLAVPRAYLLGRQQLAYRAAWPGPHRQALLTRPRRRRDMALLAAAASRRLRPFLRRGQSVSGGVGSSRRSAWGRSWSGVGRTLIGSGCSSPGPRLSQSSARPHSSGLSTTCRCRRGKSGGKAVLARWWNGARRLSDRLSLSGLATTIELNATRSRRLFWGTFCDLRLGRRLSAT